MTCAPKSTRSSRRANGLDLDELRFIFTDFTLDAVPQHYRALVAEKFEALS